MNDQALKCFLEERGLNDKQDDLLREAERVKFKIDVTEFVDTEYAQERYRSGRATLWGAVWPELIENTEYSIEIRERDNRLSPEERRQKIIEAARRLAEPGEKNRPLAEKIRPRLGFEMSVDRIRHIIGEARRAGDLNTSPERASDVMNASRGAEEPR